MAGDNRAPPLHPRFPDLHEEKSRTCDGQVFFVIIMIPSRQNYNDMTKGTPVRSFAGTVSFHGLACPGLAIGYRAAVHALETLHAGRDEELVAIMENDACGMDAIQAVTGCTTDKGNLIMQDPGNMPIP
jgi:formylmethanofuran dehydrogenase subunit E